MKATISRKDLLPPLRLLCRMAPRGKLLAPTITLQARGTQGRALRLILTAAQNRDRIAGGFEVPATIGTSITETATVDCRRLTRLVAACRYPYLRLSTITSPLGAAGGLRLVAGPIVVTIPPLEIEGGPAPPAPLRIGRKFYLEAGDLRKGLQAVLPAASEDETRIILDSVALRFCAEENLLEFAATDSYRLHRHRLSPTRRPQWGVDWLALLPDKAADLLCRALAKVPASDRVHVTAQIPPKQRASIRFRWDAGEISCEGIEGEYPRCYGRPSVWPPLSQARMVVTCESEDLIAALRLLKEIIEGDVEEVLVLPQPNRLHLIGADTHAEIRATLRVRKGSDPFAMAFQPAYLLDALAGPAGPREIRFFGPIRPIHIRDSARGPFEAVVMPMHIDDDQAAKIRKAAGAE